jgi:UPF0755 protein
MPEKEFKKKRSLWKNCFAILLLLIVILAVLATVGVNWYNDAIYSPVSSSISEISLVISEGDTLNSIADSLESKGLIKSKDALRIYLRLNNINANIKIGAYSLPKNLSVPQLITKLEEGVLKPGVRVTIKEGKRQEEVAEIISDALGSSSLFDVSEFDNIVKNPDSQEFSTTTKTFLNLHKPQGASLEGFLYPDTYEFAGDQTTLQIVEKMLENFIVKVNQEIDLSDLNLTQNEVSNLFEGITLASIIEKEASPNDDRIEISGVFHNRLQDEYLLESDATVNYITGKNDPGVRLVDKDIDSPYNTYMYPGLPPGPINSPRIQSIVAALYPNETSAYFFFHSDDGVTYYSDTIDEHVERVCEIRGCN